MWAGIGLKAGGSGQRSRYPPLFLSFVFLKRPEYGEVLKTVEQPSLLQNPAGANPQPDCSCKDITRPGIFWKFM
jgi:hypothetical protein